jgi:RND family efflux transporter MFP subunit
MKRFFAFVAAVALNGVVVAQTPYERPANEPTVEASIRSQNDVRIAAEVEGVLTQFPVREGDRVTEDQVLATIDDRQAKAAVDVARISHEAARERANDNIEERYAKAAAAVAKVNWQRDLEANQEIANAVPEIQIRQKKLEFDRAMLQIEKAGKDQLIAGKEADVKKAELAAAEIALDRRTITAPFAGEVQQLILHQAEWVNPGDAILRLVQFDVLQVDGYVNARDYDPIDVQGRPVTVKVQLARGKEASMKGRVIYVNQTVLDDEYLVRAEIQNERNGEYWLVRPGLAATMTIHVTQDPIAAPAKAKESQLK